jgi:hypothetical protein
MVMGCKKGKIKERQRRKKKMKRVEGRKKLRAKGNRLKEQCHGKGKHEIKINEETEIKKERKGDHIQIFHAVKKQDDI